MKIFETLGDLQIGTLNGKLFGSMPAMMPDTILDRPVPTLGFEKAQLGIEYSEKIFHAISFRLG
jgi:hypothetical protein